MNMLISLWVAIVCCFITCRAAQDECYDSPRECEKLSFNWTKANPYNFVRQNEGIEPFGFAAGCDRSQHCLFMEDDNVFNIMAAGLGSVFPTFQNVLSDQNPNITDVLLNSFIIYDKESVMKVTGIGSYKGPKSIGEYRVVPQFLGTAANLDTLNLIAVPSLSNIISTFVMEEKWNHLVNNTEYDRMEVTWSIDYSFYPCSIILRQEELVFPPSTAKTFSESGTIEGALESVCKIVMDHCVGEWQQYESFQDCVNYLHSLPHHDNGCQEKYGKYTAMGSSFMCKYLHHFMIPLSPPTHCSHAGKGLPDTNGNVKCTSQDCALQEKDGKPVSLSKQPACTNREVEEIAQATLYVLPYCLPSMETQSCSINCTQALNTYLGRFAESGTLCSCQDFFPGTSHLLDLIQIDAATLVALCSGNELIFKTQSCLAICTDKNTGAKCDKPGQYTGAGLKCLNWDWSKIAMSFFKEWTKNENFGRVTKSDDVATAECFVFSELYALYLNIDVEQIPDHAARLLGKDIYIHPNDSRLVTSHKDVAASFQTQQIRESLSGVVLFCDRPGQAARWMQDKNLMSLVHNTSSDPHRATRALVSSLLPGLQDQVQPMKLSSNVFDNKGILDTNELSLSLAKECARVLIQGPSVIDNPVWYRGFSKNIGDIFFPSKTWFLGEAWHRSNGYTLGTAYVAKRHSIVRSLKDIISVPTMQEKVSAAGVNASTDLAYEMTVNLITAVPLALIKLTKRIIIFIRRDPCRLLPLWKKSPQNFVIEYARLHAPVSDFVTAVGTGTSVNLNRYQISSADRDSTVFPLPDKFDPDRDLSKVLAWNFLEGEGLQSHERSCPARSFSVKFVVANVPLYFPKDILCTNEHKVYSGVKILPDSHNTKFPMGIQVLRAATSADSKTLFLFLHGFPDIPQVFSPIISHLQAKRRKDDYWMITLPGWQKTAKRSSCKLSEVAELIAKFIVSVNKKYRKVYLVGHDIGGMIGWHIANNLGREDLSGFITFAPQPATFIEAVKRIPSAQDVYFHKLMGPLVGSTFLAAGDFKILHDLLKNETWWPEYHEEYHRAWHETGAEGLTCYYRDNFFVNDNGRMEAADSSLKDLKANVNILMLSPTEDSYFPPSFFDQSLRKIDLSHGQILQLRTLQGTTHHGVLHGESAKEVSLHIDAFAKAIERKRFSLFSKFISVNSLYAPSSANNVLEHEAIIATFFLWVLGIATGITLELYLGNNLQIYRKLIDGTHVIAVVTGFASKSYIGYMIAVAGVFKFGIPDMSSCFQKGFHAMERGTKLSRFNAVLQGVAITMHHFGGLLTIASSPTGLVTLVSVLPLVIPLSFQHLIIMFDNFEWALAISTLGFEIWFQMEFFAVEGMLHFVPRIGLYMTIIAHYMYILLMGVQFLQKKLCQKKSEITNDNEIEQSIEQSNETSIHLEEP